MSYQVGYGRPPLHTRFRKGKSGNPGGQFRSGGARSVPPQDLQQVLLRVLGRKVPLPGHPERGRGKSQSRRNLCRELVGVTMRRLMPPAFVERVGANTHPSPG